MLISYQESVASRREIFIQMVDVADLQTIKTGLTLSVQIVKAGGTSYADIAGSFTEIGNGTYKIALAQSDVDTIGQAMLKVTADGAANQYIPLSVVRFVDEVRLAKAALVNDRRHVVETGVDEILDDDGVTVLRTMTPSEMDGVIHVAAAPS
jgi:hypothetical protein